MPGFTWFEYFSGTENVTFTGSVLKRLATTISGPRKLPSEMLRKPILPENGAFMVVFASLSLN